MPVRNFTVLGASKEYSIAYFGFDSEDILDQFISKYNNFVVEVDQKKKYSLEVTRAIYQAMPSHDSRDEPEPKLIQTSNPLEELDDFKHFKQMLGVKKDLLLPLEL